MDVTVTVLLAGANAAADTMRLVNTALTSVTVTEVRIAKREDGK